MEGNFEKTDADLEIAEDISCTGTFTFFKDNICPYFEWKPSEIQKFDYIDYFYVPNPLIIPLYNISEIVRQDISFDSINLIFMILNDNSWHLIKFTFLTLKIYMAF